MKEITISFISEQMANEYAGKLEKTNMKRVAGENELTNGTYTVIGCKVVFM